MAVVELGKDSNFHNDGVQAGHLDTVTYTIEKSSLADLNSDFPPIQGKSFVRWIDHYSAGGRFLEIGGGREQIAAREIGLRYPGIASYVALEPRILSSEAENELRALNYRLVKGEIGQDLPGERFDIVFAHHVFEHTELPIVNIRQSCDLLKPAGIFFCDSIPMGMETSKKFVGLLRQTGAKVAATEIYPQSSWLKAGIIRVSFAIQRGDEFTFPEVKKGEYLNDYSGQRLPVRHCYF